MKSKKELNDEIMEHGHVLQLTKEQAIKEGAESIGKTIEEYQEQWKTLPCSGECEYMYCQGWITVPNDNYWNFYHKGE